MQWTTAKIRQSFLDFFKDRQHEIVPSASIIPKGDATLLFTNAGMVPFKDYFLGIRTPASKRVVDCQKCLRISGKHNDLEAVGRDTYHHTFFEMLGNWSFGDYYKEAAIPWHWELITKVWKIPTERLWATIYTDDDEAEAVWKKIPDLPAGRILRFEKENFWEMGETGPCGPCSEIHFDRGEGACKGATHQEKGSLCAVNVEGCERFVELGNLVFIQYNRDSSGKLTPLPRKHVDTGSGLERITAAIQSLETGKLLGNYDIDLFQTIIKRIEEFAGGEPGEREIGHQKLAYGFRFGNEEYNAEVDAAFRAIADHARAITFLIADGIVPGNGDREYVLRRLIRRAVRRGHQRLAIEKPFLGAICGAVIDAMGDFYPELKTQRERIASVVTEEERRFSETLDRGLSLLRSEEGELLRKGTSILPGDIAFKLYDTYGFPLDLTQDILREVNLQVDVAGFERLMDEQRGRARAARKDDMAAPEIQLGAGTSSRFIGYQEYEREAEVLAASGKDGDSVAIVVAETPFYPEGGGQTGDRGVIEAESGALLEVVDTRKAEGSIVHIGRLLRGEIGEFEKGRRVHLKVDRGRRDASMRNHSATHILHYALRDVLGQGVHQAGSLVAPDRLRFDFHHQGAIAEGDLETIEEEINARIRENAPVRMDEMAYDDAIKAGALAFFGDKYGDVVRVIRMGDFSVELCGGTHVDATGQIGTFKLEAESGVAAGVRRVEALTGAGALEAVRKREKILEDIGHYLGARDAQALDRLEKLVAREKELEKKLRALEQKLASGAADGATSGENVVVAHGVKVVTRKVEGIEAASLREIADKMRQKHGSCVAVVGSDLGDKVALVVAVTPDLAAKLKAGDIIKQIAPMVGGSGGGRPDFAQAGGKDPSKLDAALAHVASMVG
jgi:alanyl-tRNA synthetase